MLPIDAAGAADAAAAAAAGLQSTLPIDAAGAVDAAAAAGLPSTLPIDPAGVLNFGDREGRLIGSDIGAKATSSIHPFKRKSFDNPKREPMGRKR